MSYPEPDFSQMEFFGDIEVFPGLPDGVQVFRLFPNQPWIVMMTPPAVPSYPREGINFELYTQNTEVLGVNIFN